MHILLVTTDDLKSKKVGLSDVTLGAKLDGVKAEALTKSMKAARGKLAEVMDVKNQQARNALYSSTVHGSE